MLYSGNWKLSGINVMGPDSVTYGEPQVVGLRLDRIGTRQGVRSMEWHYQTVPGADMASILTLWRASLGNAILVRYINSEGDVVEGTFAMQEPTVGKRRTFFYDSVTIRFLPYYRVSTGAYIYTSTAVSPGLSRFTSDGEILIPGIPSGEAFGTPRFFAGHVVYPSGISSSLAFGTPEFSSSSAPPSGPSTPVAIDPGTAFTSDAFGLGASWSSQFIGPFVYGTNLYVVVCLPTDPVTHPYYTDILAVYKSTDGGANWIEQDSSNHKTGQSLGGQPGPTAVQHGTTLYIAWRSVSGATIHVSQFSFSSDTWGSTVNAPSGTTTYHVLHLAVRSSGSYVLVTSDYSGDYYRSYYSVYESGSWTVTQQVIESGSLGSTADYFASGIYTDSSDNVHVIIHQYPYTGSFVITEASVEYRHRVIKPDNTLGTESGAIAGGIPQDYTDYVISNIVDDGAGTMAFVFIDQAGKLRLAKSSDSGLTPTWTNEIVYDAGSVNDTPRSAFWTGSEWIVYHGTTSHNEIKKASYSGSWSSTSLYTGISVLTVWGVPIAANRAGLLYWQYSNNKLMYVEHSPP